MILKFDYFDVKNIFLFLTFYFVLIPFLFNINMQTSYAFFIVIIGTISFLVGYKIKKRLPLTASIHKQEIYYKNILFLSVGIFFLFNDLLNGVQNLFAIKTIDDYTAGFAVTDYDSLYLQIVGNAMFFIKYYIYAILMSKNKNFFFIVFLSQLLLMMNSSTRLVALSPFIIFSIYGYYMGYIKITSFRVVTGILLLPIVFVVLLLARGKTDGLNYFQLLQNIIESLTWEKFVGLLQTALESFKSFEDFTQIVVNNFVHIESGVVRIIFMPISRSIWEDKPESISRLISQEYNTGQYESGGGTVATIFGDAFINGHIFGVFIILFTLGAISKIIYNTLKDSLLLDKKLKSVYILFYAMFVYQFLFYFRGFFSEFYWKTILLGIIFYVMYKIQFKIKPLELPNGRTI